MTDNFQTTFIPKASGKEVSSMIGTPDNRSGYTIEKILTLITVVIFLLTIFTYGYMWFNKASLNSSIEEIKKSLEIVRQSLEDGEINQITEINNRLLASSKLYAEHLAPVEIFGILEDHTLKSVSFNSLLYEYLEDDTVHIFANGSAAGYPSIVLLSDEYDKSQRMKRILVTNLKRANGEVTFSLDAFIDSDVIKYRNLERYSGGQNIINNDNK
jgi:uncharacterized membrane protein